MVAPGYGYGIVAMAALGYSGPWLWRARIVLHVAQNYSSEIILIYIRHFERCPLLLMRCGWTSAGLKNMLSSRDQS